MIVLLIQIFIKRLAGGKDVFLLLRNWKSNLLDDGVGEQGVDDLICSLSLIIMAVLIRSGDTTRSTISQ